MPITTVIVRKEFVASRRFVTFALSK